MLWSFIVWVSVYVGVAMDGGANLEKSVSCHGMHLALPWVNPLCVGVHVRGLSTTLRVCVCVEACKGE